jgi:hypothetical protein
MRSYPVVLLPLLALPVLAACGGDDDGPDETAATTTAAPSTEESSPSASPSSPDPSSPPAATDSPGAAGPGQVPRPGPGSCEPVAESADGRYVVADAGEVLLRAGDGGLSVNVSTSNGWGTKVNTDDGGADVEFRRDADELEFEADLENGRLVIRICAGG